MGNSRLKKSVNNIFVGVLNRIMLLVLNFVVRTVMIRTLGVEYLGINAIFADIMTMVSMADLGFNTAVAYSFYEPLAKNDIPTIQALTTFYKKIYNTIAIVIAVIGLSLIPFLDKIVNLEQDIPHLVVYYLLVLGDTMGSYLFAYKISVMAADQREYLQVRINMVFNLIKVGSQIVLLIWLKSYLCYWIITMATTVGSNVVASWRAEKEYPYIKEKRELDKKKKREIFDTIRSVFVYKISNVVLSGTDNTLISILVGTVQVGYYSNYFLLENSVYVILRIIFQATTASVGNLVVTENAKTRYRIFDYMQTISFCMCAVVIPCYFALADDFIGIWLGADYKIEILALIGICLNFYITTVFLPVVSFREAIGLYKKTKYFMLSAAILNIILSTLFSRKLGMAGILIATPVARCVTYVWYEAKILFRDYFEKEILGFVKQCIVNLICVTVCCAIGYQIGKYIIADNIFLWIVKGCVCGGISLIITWLVYRRSDGFQWLIDQLRRKIG